MVSLNVPPEKGVSGGPVIVARKERMFDVGVRVVPGGG